MMKFLTDGSSSTTNETLCDIASRSERKTADNRRAMAPRSPGERNPRYDSTRSSETA